MFCQSLIFFLNLILVIISLLYFNYSLTLLFQLLKLSLVKINLIPDLPPPLIIRLLVPQPGLKQLFFLGHQDPLDP